MPDLTKLFGEPDLKDKKTLEKLFGKPDKKLPPHRGDGDTGTVSSPDLPKIRIKGQGTGIPKEMQLLNPTASEAAVITPLLQALEKIYVQTKYLWSVAKRLRPSKD